MKRSGSRILQYENTPKNIPHGSAVGLLYGTKQENLARNLTVHWAGDDFLRFCSCYQLLFWLTFFCATEIPCLLIQNTQRRIKNHRRTRRESAAVRLEHCPIAILLCRILQFRMLLCISYHSYPSLQVQKTIPNYRRIKRSSHYPRRDCSKWECYTSSYIPRTPTVGSVLSIFNEQQA